MLHLQDTAELNRFTQGANHGNLIELRLEHLTISPITPSSNAISQ